MNQFESIVVALTQGGTESFSVMASAPPLCRKPPVAETSTSVMRPTCRSWSQSTLALRHPSAPSVAGLSPIGARDLGRRRADTNGRKQASATPHRRYHSGGRRGGLGDVAGLVRASWLFARRCGSPGRQRVPLPQWGAPASCAVEPLPMSSMGILDALAMWSRQLGRDDQGSTNSSMRTKIASVPLPAVEIRAPSRSSTAATPFPWGRYGNRGRAASKTLLVFGKVASRAAPTQHRLADEALRAIPSDRHRGCCNRQVSEEHAADSSFRSEHVTFLVTSGLRFLRWTLHRWVGILPLAFASPVAWARLFLGVHFTLDMIGGIPVACLSLLIVRPFRVWFVQTLTHRWINPLYSLAFAFPIRHHWVQP